MRTLKMPPRSDLVGRAFGDLTVTAYAGRGKWECLCSCGSAKTLPTSYLTSGQTRSCGCLRRRVTGERSRKNIAGRAFGRLTALEPVRIAKGQVVWRCRCECGAERELPAAWLLGGNTKSCGCLRSDNGRVASRTHGRSTSPEYRTWGNMISRCRNPRADNGGRYISRGITVCERWAASFAAFLEDMGEKPGPRYSIDRIDNNGHYEPGNCRWATWHEQNRNRRSNRMLTHDGITLTIAEWSERTGVGCGTIIYRLNRGLSSDRALAPVRKQGA